MTLELQSFQKVIFNQAGKTNGCLQIVFLTSNFAIKSSQELPMVEVQVGILAIVCYFKLLKTKLLYTNCIYQKECE